jgi:hypothetical protein
MNLIFSQIITIFLIHYVFNSITIEIFSFKFSLPKLMKKHIDNGYNYKYHLTLLYFNIFHN